MKRKCNQKTLKEFVYDAISKKTLAELIVSMFKKGITVNRIAKKIKKAGYKTLVKNPAILNTSIVSVIREMEDIKRIGHGLYILEK